jgi:hypothetical protein
MTFPGAMYYILNWFEFLKQKLHETKLDKYGRL